MTCHFSRCDVFITVIRRKATMNLKKSPFQKSILWQLYHIAEVRNNRKFFGWFRAKWDRKRLTKISYLGQLSKIYWLYCAPEKAHKPASASRKSLGTGWSRKQRSELFMWGALPSRKGSKTSRQCEVFILGQKSKSDNAIRSRHYLYWALSAWYIFSQ